MNVSASSPAPVSRPDRAADAAAVSVSVDPSAALRADHADLRARTHRLVDFVKGEDAECAIEEWGELEEAVLRHLDQVEMFILPGFTAASPEEAGRIRKEHCDLRQRLGEIGMAFELHTVRAPMVDDLVQALAAHAEREAGELARWVDGQRETPSVAATLRRLQPQTAQDLLATSVLKGLLRACRDGVRGYRRAADLAKDEGYRLMFQSYADRRAQFAGALRDRLHKIYDPTPTRGTLLGKLHRGWMEASGTLREGSPGALLRECARGETAALRTYRLALHAGLPPDLQRLVEEQHDAIKAALSEIHTRHDAERD